MLTPSFQYHFVLALRVNIKVSCGHDQREQGVLCAVVQTQEEMTQEAGLQPLVSPEL